MELLLTRVDTDTICLVGRWRNYVMIRYLQTSTHNFTAGLAARMVQHGDYVIILPVYEV